MQTKKVKGLKFKYEIGTQLKTASGRELEVTEIRLFRLNALFADIITDGYYVCKDLNTKETDIKVLPTDKVRKFRKRLSADEKDILETSESRKNFVDRQENISLDAVVDFPNEANLDELANAIEIGFDIETYGLIRKSDGLVPARGKIRLIQAYLPELNKTIVWDLGDITNQKSIESIPGFNILKQKLISKKCTKYIHNAAFESAWIAEHFKCPILNVVDSMILSQLYWAGLMRGFNAVGVKNPNSLEQVCIRLFGIKPDKTNQGYDYAMPLGNSQYNYAALDAKLTFEAGKKLRALCIDEGMQTVVEAEMMAIPAFAQMNYKGVPVNVEKLKELLAIYSKQADDTIQPWLATFPNSNPGSSKQVLECLKAKWGIEPYSTDSKTKEKKLSSDNATLTPYALENPIIDALLFWRSLKKDCEYLEQYLESVKTVRGFTVLTGNYRQNAPNVTGRSSSSKPNLQNIPTPTPRRKKLGLPALRTAFQTPPGYKMLLVDLAASHAQIARYLSQDKKLIEANESGIKLHFYTVQGILEMVGIKASVSELAKAKKDKNHPLYKHVSELYDPAKTVFYGGLNLNGAATLQASFLKKADMLVSLAVCKYYVDGGRKAYSGLYRFQQETIKKANSLREQKQFEIMTEEGIKKLGMVTKTYGTSRSVDGGRLFIEKMPNDYTGSIEASGTDCVSYQWLRPEATIIKKSMGLINDVILKNRMDAWICQMTHDEIGCIVKESQAVDLAAFMNQIITECFQELIPDYLVEDAMPYNCIINNWSEK